MTKYQIVVEPNALDSSKVNIVVFMTDKMGIKRTFINMTYDKRDEAKGVKLAQQRIYEQGGVAGLAGVEPATT